jgi:putative restriction endonuclease
MNLRAYQEKFINLRVNMTRGNASPHKICMLLALLDLAQSGGLTKNIIEFGPALLERYKNFFQSVSGPTDHLNPYFPFFHLSGKLKDGSASFWHLVPSQGKENILNGFKTVTKASDITDNVDHAMLDPELFELLQDKKSIDALGQTIATHWFDRGLEELKLVMSKSNEVSQYEKLIRSGAPLPNNATTPDYVRSPAFRRVVTQLYDYRCAATGLRFLLATGEAMVEAAHIHPFHEAGDDDPCNGLALTPNMHWAMDRNLISPGPDLKWHVSSLVDERIADNAVLINLKNKPLILPADLRMAPKREVLEWRLERLREYQGNR